MKTPFLLATLLAVPLLATAGVNPKNGNFFISYKDIALQSGDHELDLTRTYNSRATELGWFGYGWGSRFETRLVAMPDGSAAVQENGTGQIIYYRPAYKADVQGGAARIAEAVARRDQLTPDAAARLRDNLAADEDLRVRKVLQYGLQTDLPDGTELRSEECGAAHLTRTAEGYRRSKCERGMDYFDMQGRLIRREESDGYSMSASYAGSRPGSIKDSSGKSIDLEWTPDGLLAGATSGSQHRVIYTYSKAKDLTKSNDPNGNYYNYEYDGNHNLTRIGYIDDSSMRIEYVSAANGDVKSVAERSGEKTLYEYRSDPADAGHTWTRVTSISEGGRPSSREYEYQQRRTETGAEQLARFSASSNHNRLETTYDKKGRVIRKANAEGGFSDYIYHPQSDKLILVFSNDLKTVFHYDDQGNLTRAENSDGRVVELEYRGTQQIQRMQDIDRKAKTRHDVSFRYNALGKPVEITLAGAGKISVTYDDKGEITNVSSDQGAKMALQITKIFQDLLSVVQVAGARF